MLVNSPIVESVGALPSEPHPHLDVVEKNIVLFVSMVHLSLRIIVFIITSLSSGIM